MNSEDRNVQLNTSGTLNVDDTDSETFSHLTAMDSQSMLNRDVINLDSEYGGNMKRHIRAIKWIAMTFMVAVGVSIPGIVLVSVSSHSQTLVDQAEKLNHTACLYAKQYHLNENVYITVCNMNGDVLLDIRQFLNNTATIKGIQLNLRQWLTLKQMSRPIDVAIMEARTYWKHLKALEKIAEDE